jgi:hypothetical protein
MIEGYLLDQGHHSTLRISRWVAGKPERGAWKGLKIGDRDVVEVCTFKCSGCGFLESYANKL